MLKKNDLFCFTEAFGCEDVLYPFVKSYNAHNQIPIVIFGRKEYVDRLFVDLQLNTKVFINGSDFLSSSFEKLLLDEYLKKGHSATAIFWTFLIKVLKKKRLFHFDSDLIFVKNVDSAIHSLVDRGIHLSGLQRHQEITSKGLFHFLIEKITIRGVTFARTINTQAFFFNASLIAFLPREVIKRLIECSGLYGSRIIFGDALRDFFDPVSLIYGIFGKCRFIDNDSELYKGIFQTGSAIGSGSALHSNGFTLADKLSSYQRNALENYYVFARLILKHNDIPDVEISGGKLKNIQKLNLEKWTLS
jgi:hypothetical protein